MQLDQRGGVKGSMGCIDNLSIDKAILEDANKNKKNLSCLRVKVKKAFDGVSHYCPMAVLHDYGFNQTLTSFIKSIRIWKTTLFAQTTEGRATIGPINVKCEIMQGDSLCFTLFTFCLNPMACYLWSTEGNTFTQNKEHGIDLWRQWLGRSKC